MSSMGGDDLTVHASLDNDVSPELREIKEDLRGVGTQATTTGRQASRSARGFDVLNRAGKLAATGVKLAFGAALGAGYAAVRLLGASFREATEAQKVGATTNAIIKSTGGAARVTAGHVGKLSTRLSLMAGVDDELIQTGANLLLTFKNVRNETGKGGKVFDRATTSAVDLAAAGFGSVDSASKMLGKALNDPLKGITALSRAGVTFTAGQQDTIKSLVEQGRLLDAQKIILGEVESQVGGVAKAQATWRDKAVVYIGNIEEKLGTALLPVLDDISRWFVKDGGPMFDGWVRTFRREGVPAIHDFVDEAKPIVREWLPKIADTMGDVADVTKTAAGYAGELVGAFLNAPPWVRKALVGGGIAAGLGAKLNLGSLLGSSKPGNSSGLLGLVSKAKPLPVLVTNPGFAAGTAAGGRGAGVAPVPTGGDTSADDRRTRRRTNAAKGLGLAGLALTLTNPEDLKEAAGVLKDNAHAWGDVIKDNRLGNGIADKLRERRNNVDPDPWAGSLPAHATITDNMVAKQKYMADQADRLAMSSPRVAAGYQKEADSLAAILATGTKTKPFLDSLFNDTVVPGVSSVKALNEQNGVLASTKVDPTYTTPGLPEAQTKSNFFLDTLKAIGSPVNTQINVDTTAALQAVHNFAAQANAALAGFLGGGGGGGVDTPTTPKHHRKPDPVETPTTTQRGAAGRGGVTVHPGGIVVHAEGAASTVDVQRAVLDALEEHERDQYERGNG